MAYRTKLESSGALQIAVGAVLIVIGIAAASNENAAPVFGALLIVGGALLATFGVIRNVRQRPTTDAQDQPEA